LIELLVVIAIIGILASVVLAGLESQRDRAREVSVISSARSVVPVATICVDGGGSLAAIAAGDETGGTDVCDDTGIANDTWPDISNHDGWVYQIVTDSGDNWSFRVCEGDASNACPNGQRGIECTLTGCTTVGTLN